MSDDHVNQMKIAYIMSRFPKLTETFVLYEILEQLRLGTEVEVYPLLRHRSDVRHPDVDSILGTVHYSSFLSWDIARANAHYVLRSPLRYLKTVSEVFWGVLPSRNFLIGAAGIFLKAVWIAQQAEQRGVTHVHAHFATHPAVAALIVQRLTGIPFSFTAHGSDLHVDQTMLDKKVEAADFAIAISSYNKKMMLAICGAQADSKIHIIHCGVDTNFFAPRAQRKSPGPLKIICVASFEEVKGHKYLIEACALLRKRDIDFTCCLVGDGPLREQFTSQVQSAGLGERVVIEGGCARPKVRDLLQQSDVAVLASAPTRNGKREGIPVSLMEAMACGLPVVSSDISGIPELVHNGRTGLLVPPANSAALADALQELQENPELRHRLGQSAREAVVRDFSLTSSAATLNYLFARHAAPLVQVEVNALASGS